MVDKVVDNYLYCHTDSTEALRIHTCQHSKKQIQYSDIRTKLKYVFTVVPGSSFVVTFDGIKGVYLPYIAIYAQSTTSSSTLLYNFHLEKKNFSCRRKHLKIVSVKDLKNTCANVTIEFNGSGGVYLLSRKSHEQAPSSLNIIDEGVYLGMYF